MSKKKNTVIPPADLTVTQCASCDNGTPQPTRVLNHKTFINGYPFTVPQAWFGVCDVCGERETTAAELKRWKAIFQAQADRLTPQAIEALRGRLGLGRQEFAQLIGATRQSVRAWEHPNRTVPQGRSVDLVMKMLEAALVEEGPPDVLGLLLAEAKKWGVEIEVALSAEAAG